MTLLADTLPPLEIQARQKGLGFVCEIDPDTPEHLRGDPSRLRQIIVNLVGNSVKFTQRGEIRIRIASTRSTEDGGPVRLNLDFSDTGIGISTSKIATVFEPFTQADSSVTRCYGGTGLGLAIVHSLVKLMHGGITLESQEGKGSVFHVALQFENARSMPAPKMSPSLLPSLTNEPRPALDILLVEDNLLNQRMVCRLLKLHGHSVSTAGDGLAALEAYHTKSFDLILMDVHMPELDGFAVTAKIRDLEKVNSRKTPIVAMTAKAMRGDREACLQAGMDEYLSKPLRPEELWTVLDRFGRPPHRAPLPNSGAEKKPHVPDNSLFDEKTALARVEGNRELFVELIGIFLSEWPQIQKKIKIAMGSCDWTSLQMHLHNAKGLTANLGSAAAASAAKEAESRVKARRLEGLDLAVEQVFQSVENLRSALFQAFPEALQLEKPGV
jgi:CheY-like chemotaxis protein